jgi:pimeloyl-ACP methyl ester carboxylesterase
VLAAAFALNACAPVPVVPPPGFAERVVEGAPFHHRIFSKGHPGGGVLHVYIEGDGRGWLTRHTVSRDPTPLKPLMLELMALDPQPSAYLGRPCYFGLASSAGCDARLWTSHRYSAEVVGSLERVIEVLLAEGDYSAVVLFGHSGGGTLATLLASRLPQTRALVTIGANLDVGAWADLHGYTPLTGSLDPAREREFPTGIFQVHWAGSRDTEIPPSLLLALRPYLGDDGVRIRDGFDHDCCWNEIWPRQLTEIDSHLAREKNSNDTLAAQRTIGLQETDP